MTVYIYFGLNVEQNGIESQSKLLLKVIYKDSRASRVENSGRGY